MPTQPLSSGHTYSPETNVTRLNDFEPPQPDLSAGRVWRAWELVDRLHCRHSEDSRFRLALTRWYRSRSISSPPLDCVVDLRAALEALYLDSGHNELAFRLATTAARHLKASVDERREVQRTLTRFCNLASKVVHKGDVDLDDETNAQLVRRASRLCRDGILKILEDRSTPDWSDLLLR